MRHISIVSGRRLLAGVMAAGLAATFALTAAPASPAQAVAAQGDVYSWGYGFYGQLGAGTNNSNGTPAQIAAAGQAADIAGGCYHSLVARSDGSVWSWGYNGFGQLGNGSDGNTNTPAQIGGLTATQVAGGCYHSLALKADGTVWAWGNNSFNNLGIGGPAADTCLGFGGGGINCSKSPVQVSGLSGVQSIVSGITFNLALRTDGTVWAWGQHYGSVPVQVGGLSGITAIGAGSYHALAVKADGSVWTWGDDLYESLGNGTATGASYTPAQVAGLSGVVSVTGGGWHSLALKADGTVWGWGRNTQGQVGNGVLTTTGCNCIPLPTQVIALSGVKSITASQTASLGLKTDGTVSAWGSNFSGEFGNGSFNAGSATPVTNPTLANVSGIAAGGYHVLAAVQNNQAPTVDANGPYTVTEGGTVSLSATGSDPDGDTLTYAWDLDDDGSFETAGQTVSFSAAALTAPDSQTVRVRATDTGGLSATDTASVGVHYAFGGFLQPIESLPARNIVKAGRSVPVKFSLGGDEGLAIFAAGYPVSQQITCDTSAPAEVVEETTSASASGLTYDPATGQYNYTWKTSKEWTDTCRQLTLRLVDGAIYKANFQFD